MATVFMHQQVYTINNHDKQVVIGVFLLYVEVLWNLPP